MLTWLGLIGTFGFGGFTLYQFIVDRIERRVRDAERRHIEALGNSLAHLRLICNDAADRGEILKTDASKQFARQLALGLLSAEAHVKAVEESLTSAKHRATN